jgi:hypothetical protein
MFWYTVDIYDVCDKGVVKDLINKFFYFLCWVLLLIYTSHFEKVLSVRFFLWFLGYVFFLNGEQVHYVLFFLP